MPKIITVIVLIILFHFITGFFNMLGGKIAYENEMKRMLEMGDRK